MSKKYKLGPKAGFFFDPSTQKKVMKGESVKFSDRELTSIRTIAAINSGHIVASGDKVEEEVKLLDKFHDAYDAGEIANVVKKFKLKELQALAEERGFEIDTSDTKEMLAQALVSDIYEEE